MYDGGNPFAHSFLKKLLMIVLRLFLPLLFVSCITHLFGQSYNDSLQTYLDGYVKKNEVVRGADRKYFQFYPIDQNYRVNATFEKAKDDKWFSMETSAHLKQTYRVYGTVSFTIHDTLVKADIYQSQDLLGNAKYKDYLALMFTDKTTGDQTYHAGRYIDLKTGDIKDDKVVIDFNKAYNPPCAFSNFTTCPVAPKQNVLKTRVEAGEKYRAK